MSGRHRKPAPITSALQHKPVRIAAGVAGSALIMSAAVGPAVTHWAGQAHQPAGLDQEAALRPTGAGTGVSSGAARSAGGGQVHGGGARGDKGTPAAAKRAALKRSAQRSARQSAPPAVPPGYSNPLRSISGLVPERIDMGVDFGGSGPIYALGSAVITNATGNSAGWPGGGWITYQLTSGPGAGLTVYVAEDVTPTVSVGQEVSSATVIANMYNGGSGIETGWAQPGGVSAESQLPAAGSISGGGPFPTSVGLNFDELLQTLGVPAANNSAESAYGLLPPNYPADWAAVTKDR